VIFFKDDDIPDIFLTDETFNNRFWIFQGTEGYWNWQRKFIICNEDILNNQFDFLKQVGNSDSGAVSFEGD